MPRLGDRTFDVPCITSEGVEEPEKMRADAKTALDWLNEYIEKNDVPCSVRIVSNPHEFGSYPSIEVDYNIIHDCMDEMCDDNDRDEVMGKIDAMEEAYSERFKDNL